MSKSRERFWVHVGVEATKEVACGRRNRKGRLHEDRLEVISGRRASFSKNSRLSLKSVKPRRVAAPRPRISRVPLDEPGEHRAEPVCQAETYHQLLLADEPIPSEPLEMSSGFPRFTSSLHEALPLLLGCVPIGAFGDERLRSGG